MTAVFPFFVLVFSHLIIIIIIIVINIIACILHVYSNEIFYPISTIVLSPFRFMPFSMFNCTHFQISKEWQIFTQKQQATLQAVGSKIHVLMLSFITKHNKWTNEHESSRIKEIERDRDTEGMGEVKIKTRKLWERSVPSWTGNWELRTNPIRKHCSYDSMIEICLWTMLNGSWSQQTWVFPFIRIEKFSIKNHCVKMWMMWR